MPVEFWILIIPLLFLVTDFVASFISVNAGAISFDRVLENVQSHILLRASTLLAFIPLTPLYLIAQQHKLFQLEDSLLNILLVILIYDFTYYWFHRYSHYAKPLWAIHIVHHQPEQLEASVTLRASFFSPAITWVLSLPLIYVGFPGEVIVIAFVAHAFYQVPCHNQWFPRIKWLEYLLITPSLHRVHHGKNKPYVNTNFGNMFSIWDRLFGSLQTETEGKVAVGVKDVSSHNVFLANLQLFLTKTPAAVSPEASPEILSEALDEPPLVEHRKTAGLRMLDVSNILLLLVVSYFYYLQPAYLLLAASGSILIFVLSHKYWQLGVKPT